MKYGQNLKKELNHEETKFSFNKTIFEKMIKSSSTQLNIDVKTIDKLTGMTPLELAIREQNTVITEVSLEHCQVKSLMSDLIHILVFTLAWC